MDVWGLLEIVYQLYNEKKFVVFNIVIYERGPHTRII